MVAYNKRTLTKLSIKKKAVKCVWEGERYQVRYFLKIFLNICRIRLAFSTRSFVFSAANSLLQKISCALRYFSRCHIKTNKKMIQPKWNKHMIVKTIPHLTSKNYHNSSMQFWAMSVPKLAQFFGNSVVNNDAMLWQRRPSGHSVTACRRLAGFSTHKTSVVKPKFHLTRHVTSCHDTTRVYSAHAT